MPAASTFDYAIIRIVPNVERGEFINVGVILFCRTQRFLAAQIALDIDRARTFAPHLDWETVQTNLKLIPEICQGAGPIGELPQTERFHWLVAPRSTIIQVSPVHSGFCQDPDTALNHLVETMVQL